jgi:hypothetical protein
MNIASLLGSVTVFAETSYTGEGIGVSKNGTTIYKTTSKDMAHGE